MIQQRGRNASASLQDLLVHNRLSGKGGVYAVCSAHPWVIDSAIQQAKENGSFLHIESTSSQVNQLGGYSGQTPSQFADSVHAAARRMGLPQDQILLGGDHLGPYPWRTEASGSALNNACELARACVLAGYRKLHLDASMACADDPKVLSEQTVAQRAVVLCQAAEEALKDSPPGTDLPLYVIGTEVPVPGGESATGAPPAVTTVESLHQTLRVFQEAFEERGLSAAWQRVIAVVVQPGVEFGDDLVFAYDRTKARSLSEGLPSSPSLVYEAHSTDYQSPGALAQMVEDHFAILKVGPWLTFAFREAVFALSAIEQELLAGEKSQRLSQVREALDQAMLRKPTYWRSYYRGDERQLRIARAYSYSDRCRYYWHEKSVQAEIERLIENLAARPVPLTLVSQYLPREYEAIRAEQIANQPGAIIRCHIQFVLRSYATACGMVRG
ncbi:MAG TPA: class II D-tagatose-bisphosphate aldolase, non-catalytic subunit [Candidatus Sulfotelmatobacter sp.]|nr:class II D-tagatose-bisphosphate aldolase, non-catalytic subunit [Candidatus Sulfotelmatobacter sp.]